MTRMRKHCFPISVSPLRGHLSRYSPVRHALGITSSMIFFGGLVFSSNMHKSISYALIQFIMHDNMNPVGIEALWKKSPPVTRQNVQSFCVVQNHSDQHLPPLFPGSS